MPFTSKVSLTFWPKNIGTKAAHSPFMKLTPVVYFINILLAAFAPIFFGQKVTKPNCN